MGLWLSFMTTICLHVNFVLFDMLCSVAVLLLIILKNFLHAILDENSWGIRIQERKVWWWRAYFLHQTTHTKAQKTRSLAQTLTSRTLILAHTPHPAYIVEGIWSVLLGKHRRKNEFNTHRIRDNAWRAVLEATEFILTTSSGNLIFAVISNGDH